MNTQPTHQFASQSAMRRAFDALQEELETVLRHVRSYLVSEEATVAAADTSRLDAYASRVLRAMAEGDERASLVRKEIDSRRSEVAERSTTLGERVAALSASKTQLEDVGDSRVLWPAQALGVLGAVAAAAGAIYLVLGIGVAESVVLAVSGAVFGAAAAYALYSLQLSAAAWAQPATLAVVCSASAVLAWAVAQLADIDGVQSLVAVVFSALNSSVGYASLAGVLATQLEQNRRRLLSQVTNGLAAAHSELERVLPEERAWLEEASAALVEMEQSHHLQARHHFATSASDVIGRAEASTQPSLEAHRDVLLVEIDRALDAHLGKAIRGEPSPA